MSKQNSSNNGTQDAYRGLGRANDQTWTYVQRQTYNADYTRQQNQNQNQNQFGNGSGSGGWGGKK